MFLGYLEEIGKKFQKSEALKAVFYYLYELLDEESERFMKLSKLEANQNYEEEIGFGIKAIPQCYFTKEPQKAFYESHQEMVDFQMVCEGREAFFVAPKELCKIKTPYNPQKDLQEYYPTPYCSTLLLFRGNLAVFEESDVHAGGIQIKESELVKKVVLKVPRELVKLNF
ncbi:hypothetical protein B6S12_00920 [Helicobacter valdiviensis]|uniref:YhcH/YjgK/YiaL family protein n=1 Tax=Helicobacter valdiviensis TaxID=1458358 RepID=A0A2W6MZS1_9HELI|nr:YhcH/YjgK/YiaL family protein [Helicobacter valdiviensis]PZT48888.1 hypothetical protein B6S12_00920 [Helicobacter valdiviensis]